MSLYEQFANAPTQGRGNRIEEPELGQSIDYIVALGDVEISDSKRGDGVLYIIQFTIKEGTEKNPAGSDRSHVYKPEKRRMIDPGNIRLFAGAVLGKEGSEPDVSEQDFKDIEAGKYKGTLLKLTVSHIQTGAGFDFYPHTWRPAATPELPQLTKKAWLKGEGPGTPHPDDPNQEYHPEHTDWGTRKKA